MPTVGALARVQITVREDTKRELAALPGVETFDLEDEQQLGVLIEAPSLDEAHAVLSKDIPRATGVLCVWPVYMNHEDVLGDTGAAGRDEER